MSSDRNLLFGILALHNGIVNRDQLVEAMTAWMARKESPLGDILQEQGALAEDDRRFLDDFVARQIRQHGDAAKSLASLRVDPVTKGALEWLPDAEAQASLATVSPLNTPQFGGEGIPELYAAVGGAVPTCPRYRQLRPHARGGLGEVFVAVDEELSREVALKQIQDRFADDADIRSRFLREAEITGRLEHPGIVPVYGLDADERGRPRYAMRFIHGDSLAEVIKRFHAADLASRDPAERRLALRGLLTRFIDVCNAVAYAHSRGVIHRDIKPSNVMLGPYGETLTVDWGMAKAVAQDEDTTRPHQPVAASLSAPAPTQQGQVVGTLAFMAPEQARGEHDMVGPAADVFALGATLYCLLTGRPPHPGPSAEALALAAKGEFSPARQVNGRVPAALEAVCHKAMAPTPEGRYASAGELAGEVERWLADEPVRAYPDPWAARAGRWARRHRTLVASLGVLLASAVVALSASNAAVLAEQRRTAKQKDLAQQAAREANENYQIASALTHKLVIIVEERLPRINGAEPARKELLDAAVPAINRFREQRPEDSKLTAWTAQLHRNSANLHRLLGKPDTAEPLYREAIRLEEALAALEPDDPAHRDRLAQTWRDHASLLKMIGRLPEAFASVNHSAEVAERLLAGRRDSPAFHRTLAAALSERSDVLYQLGRPDESLGDADRAVKLYRALVGVPAKDAHLLDPLLFAIALNRVGTARRELGRPDEALKAHDEAAVQLRAMLKRGDIPNARHFLARTLFDQAEVFRRKKDQGDRASQALDAALAIWDGMVKNFPNTPIYQEFRALTHAALGESQLGKGEAMSAGKHLAAAREQLKKLAKENSHQASYRANLGRVYGVIGRQAESQGKTADAAKWYRRAAEELRQAGKAAPENALDRKALEQVKGALRRLKG